MCIYALFTFPSCSHPAFVAHSYCEELQERGGPLETRPAVSPYGINMLFADDKTLLERADFVRTVQELEPKYFGVPNASQSLVDLTNNQRNIGNLHRGARSCIDLPSSATQKKEKKKRYDVVEAQRMFDVALSVAEANNRNREGVTTPSPSSSSSPDNNNKKQNRGTRIIDAVEYTPVPIALMSKGKREANIPEVILEEDEELADLDMGIPNDAILEEENNISDIQRNAETLNEVPGPLKNLHVKGVQYHVIYPNCKKIEAYRINGWPFLEEVCGPCAKKAWRAERASRGGKLLRKKSSEMLKEISKLAGNKRKVEDAAVDEAVNKKPAKKWKPATIVQRETSKTKKKKGWLRWLGLKKRSS